MAQNISSMLKYVPFLALLYAIYSAYGSRGFSGFLADLKALPNILKSKAAMTQLGYGLAILIAGGYLVKRYMPGGSAGKYLGVAAVYYLGATQIASAIKSGAGYAGDGEGISIRSNGSSMQSIKQTI